MAAERDTIGVEVAYARPDRQLILTLRVPRGCTVERAIRESGILEQFPEIDLAVNKTGIFSKAANLEDMLRDGDRVEIYRPLKADPREVRRRLAEQGKTMRKGDRGQ